MEPSATLLDYPLTSDWHALYPDVPRPHLRHGQAGTGLSLDHDHCYNPEENVRMYSLLICCNWVDIFPSYGPRYGELQADELFLALIEHSHVQNRGSARTRTAMSTMATSSLGTSPRWLPWRIDLLLATRYLRVCIGVTNVALSVRNHSHSSRGISYSDCA